MHQTIICYFFRFIANMINASNKRKVEKEISHSHQLKKDLEEEKESNSLIQREIFVTESYKRSLEDRKKLEQELQNENKNKQNINMNLFNASMLSFKTNGFLVKPDAPESHKEREIPNVKLAPSNPIEENILPENITEQGKHFIEDLSAMKRAEDEHRRLYEEAKLKTISKYRGEQGTKLVDQKKKEYEERQQRRLLQERISAV